MLLHILQQYPIRKGPMYECSAVLAEQHSNHTTADQKSVFALLVTTRRSTTWLRLSPTCTPLILQWWRTWVCVRHRQDEHVYDKRRVLSLYNCRGAAVLPSGWEVAFNGVDRTGRHVVSEGGRVMLLTIIIIIDDSKVMRIELITTTTTAIQLLQQQQQ